MRTLGTLEKGYRIPSPPCKRCGGCEFKSSCKTYAQGGTIVTLTLDRSLGQSKGPAALMSEVFEAVELTIDPLTIATNMAKEKPVRTLCLKDIPVVLQPRK